MDICFVGTGDFVIRCSRRELALLEEGLHALEDAGRMCLEEGSVDEFDVVPLQSELATVAGMRGDAVQALRGGGFSILD